MAAWADARPQISSTAAERTDAVALMVTEYEPAVVKATLPRTDLLPENEIDIGNHKVMGAGGEERPLAGLRAIHFMPPPRTTLDKVCCSPSCSSAKTRAI